MTDPRVVRALNHPIRVQILRALDEGEASPVEVARAIGERLATVTYHFNTLAELGLIELVREVPRRGALQHFYESRRPDPLEGTHWEDLPRLAKADVRARPLAELGQAISNGLVDGGFERRQARSVPIDVQLDEAGWREAAREIDALSKRLRQLERESRKRAKTEAGELSSAAGALLLFERSEST